MAPEGIHFEEWSVGGGARVIALPVLDGSAEFAVVVRRAIREVAPPVVAVEWPESLGEPLLRAVARLPKVSVIAYTCRDGGAAYHLVEPADPAAEAVRTALETGAEVVFVDADLDRLNDPEPRYPDPHVLTLSSHAEYVGACFGAPQAPLSDTDILRCRHMAVRLADAAAGGSSVMFVGTLRLCRRVGEELCAGGRAEVLRRPRRDDVGLFHVTPESLPRVMAVSPFLQAAYELRRDGVPPLPDLAGSTVRRRVGPLELIAGTAGWDEERALDDAVRWIAAANGPDAGRLDRHKGYYHLGEMAARHYGQETSEVLEAWQKRGLFRFLRNLSLLSGMLVPDLPSFVEAARSFADDNFMYAAWRLGAHYPWQRGDGGIASVELSAQDMRLGERTFRIRRRLHRPKARRVRLPARSGAKGPPPSEWLKGFDPQGICSHEPESAFAERFRRWARGKALKVLSEEEARVEPFRGSILDGIDMRETIRHLPDGEIHVRQLARVRGGAENVVVIFEEDPEGERHPYRLTWLGEHEEEADEAFYSTSPLDNVVGPGICRCEYGGFLHVYPPGRLGDVWEDPDYDWTRTPAERLLAAAIDYSTERHVVYVAPRPPRGYLKQYAARCGRSIVYIPSGTVSRVTMKKLRVMHILNGRDKRETAAKYIW